MATLQERSRILTTPAPERETNPNLLAPTVPSLITLTPSSTSSATKTRKTGKIKKEKRRKELADELPNRVQVYRPSKFANLLEKIEAEGNLYPQSKHPDRCSTLSNCLTKVWSCCLCSSDTFPLGILLASSKEIRRSFGVRVLLMLGLYFALPIPVIIVVGLNIKPRWKIDDNIFLGGALAALLLHVILYVFHRVYVVRKRTSALSSSLPYLTTFIILSEILLIAFTALLTLYLEEPGRKSVLDGRKFLPLLTLIILSSNCFILALSGISAPIEYTQTKVLTISLIICSSLLLALTLIYSLFYAVEILQGRGNDNNSVSSDLLRWLPILIICSIIITVGTTRELQMLLAGRRASINSTDPILAVTILTFSFIFPSILNRVCIKIRKSKGSAKQRVAPTKNDNTRGEKVEKLPEAKDEEEH